MGEKKVKVYEFSRNGYSYKVKAESKEQAKKCLNGLGVDIKNCIEIPKAEWDKKTVKMYEDNNTENEPFYISLRELFNEEEAELLCTNDPVIFD
jgi:hypothetical protein